MDRFCVNPNCGKLLVRRDDEVKQNFDRRKTCDVFCAAAYRHSLRPPKRYCEAPGCKRPIERRKGETAPNFAKRKTCSQKCHAAVFELHSNLRKKRHCANPKCRKVLVKRDNEQAANFLRRNTCDRNCGRTWRRLRQNDPVDDRERARDADPVQRFLCDYRTEVSA